MKTSRLNPNAPLFDLTPGETPRPKLARSASQPLNAHQPAATAQDETPASSHQDSWTIAGDLIRFGGGRCLHQAAISGDGIRVRQLLETGESPNQPNSMGYTPLHFAAAMGKVSTMQQLIDAGANMNTTSEDGKTPLTIAVEYQQAAAVAKLLSLGVDDLGRTKNGESAREIAARLERHDLFEMLERFNPQRRGQWLEHKTSELLANLKQGSLLAALSADAASLNTQTVGGKSLLHLAVASCDLAAMRVLLAAGASPNLVDNEGNTPLHEAARMNDHAAYALLVQSGGFESVRNNDGHTPGQLLDRMAGTAESGQVEFKPS